MEIRTTTSAHLQSLPGAYAPGSIAPRPSKNTSEMCGRWPPPWAGEGYGTPPLWKYIDLSSPKKSCMVSKSGSSPCPEIWI